MKKHVLLFLLFTGCGAYNAKLPEGIPEDKCRCVYIKLKQAEEKAGHTFAATEQMYGINPPGSKQFDKTADRFDYLCAEITVDEKVEWLRMIDIYKYGSEKHWSEN